MDCISHPGTSAAAACSSCGLPVCESCLVRAADGRFLCRPCSVTGGMPVARDPSGLAIASLVVSIASIFICPLGAPPGMIMGLVELGRIRRGQSPRQGYGFALAGAITGGVISGFMILFLIGMFFIFVLAASA